MLYFKETRSVICVVFSTERSARRCRVCRNILRWPEVNLVSNVSPAEFDDAPGIAPFRSPGLSSGSVKHAASKAGEPGVAPFAPVKALFGVQALEHEPAVTSAEVHRGSMGFVIPSKML